jgi:hypothetical protein
MDTFANFYIEDKTVNGALPFISCDGNESKEYKKFPISPNYINAILPTAKITTPITIRLAELAEVTEEKKDKDRYYGILLFKNSVLQSSIVWYGEDTYYEQSPNMYRKTGKREYFEFPIGAGIYIVETNEDGTECETATCIINDRKCTIEDSKEQLSKLLDMMGDIYMSEFTQLFEDIKKYGCISTKSGNHSNTA